MACAACIGTIGTARLDLVPLTSTFVRAVVEARVGVAEGTIGARLAPWLVGDASEFVRLHLAGDAAAAAGFDGFGRVIVVRNRGGGRLAIGTVGFQGPPDDRGRLEIGCSISPGHRRRGYAREAVAGLLDWATERYGVTRYVISIPHWRSRAPRPVDISARSARSSVGS